MAIHCALHNVLRHHDSRERGAARPSRHRGWTLQNVGEVDPLRLELLRSIGLDARERGGE